MSSRKITLADYDPNWPAKFEAEKLHIANSLDDCFVDCFHIGSTSVQGLAAKPVIDMLLIVSSIQTLDSRQSALEAIGYVAKGENGIAGRRYFYKGRQVRNFHLHAYEPAHPDIIRHLAFRDYLRNNPEISKEYQEIKKRALRGAKNSSELYVASKDPFIKKHEAIALSLAQKRRR
ncbi:MULTISPECIES: GrpB family protein [unclassified Brenneria]|uniref:GrpB family protein n=1 Tax=unclassified Brenneria TaxID=2634434 RepID=UPI0029C2045C|nr:MULTISPECIES: GrpB family protein [unclassified Brenneria]MDX5626912.1 GrpB family protein [Brenneria sp. L3-3Z]MDX5693738.1 GrpB family protein [Brenneria sp. L4-2C]